MAGGKRYLVGRNGQTYRHTGGGVWMISSPEKGHCRDRTQGYVFRVHFEPLRQISIQKGVLRSAYIVGCKVRASAKPQSTLDFGTEGEKL